MFTDVVPEQRAAQLAEFIALLSRAQAPELGRPFLSLRYHFFLRALEGAFVRFTSPKEIVLVPDGGERCQLLRVSILSFLPSSRHTVVALRICKGSGGFGRGGEGLVPPGCGGF